MGQAFHDTTLWAAADAENCVTVVLTSTRPPSYLRPVSDSLRSPNTSKSRGEGERYGPTQVAQCVLDSAGHGPCHTKQ